MSDEIKLEPITASVWETKTFIVCVNPVNPDDKMEFASFVEMSDKLFELKMLSEALKAEIEKLKSTLTQLQAYEQMTGIKLEKIEPKSE